MPGDFVHLQLRKEKKGRSRVGPRNAKPGAVTPGLHQPKGKLGLATLEPDNPDRQTLLTRYCRKRGEAHTAAQVSLPKTVSGIHHYIAVADDLLSPEEGESTVPPQRIKAARRSIEMMIRLLDNNFETAKPCDFGRRFGLEPIDTYCGLLWEVE